MAVTEIDLYNAIKLKFMTALETINTTDFTFVGTSANFEGSTSAFPNGRSEKVVDFVNAHFSHNPNILSMDSGIFTVWLKPDFAQTYGTSYWICSTLEDGPSSYDGWDIAFANAADDFAAYFYDNGSYKGACETVGATWSADSVHSLTIMWHYNAGLDDSKSVALYFDGTLYGTCTFTWSAGRPFNTSSNLGANRDQGAKWDGGMFDAAYLEYDTLAASYTDAEIAAAIHSNTFGAGSTHKFLFELAGSPTSPGLTVAARKLRLMTNTAGTATTALEIDSSQTVNVPVKLEVDGTLETSGAVTFNTDSEDLDFTINKNTSGTAIVYDAGLDETRIGTPSTNYTAIEADGTIEFNGDATVWNDLQFNIETGRVSAANYPDWDSAFTTNTGCYKFDVDDYIDLGSNEMPHDWKEGSSVYPHIHIALDGANTSGSSQYAKFTIYLAYADVE